MAASFIEMGRQDGVRVLNEALASSTRVAFEEPGRSPGWNCLARSCTWEPEAQERALSRRSLGGWRRELREVAQNEDVACTLGELTGWCGKQIFQQIIRIQ